MRRQTFQTENSQSKKSSRKNVSKKKMLFASITSFEVSPYDFIKAIASNKAVLNLPDLKCKENCNLAVKELNKVLTNLFYRDIE